jgi:hypothetical protein
MCSSLCTVTLLSMFAVDDLHGYVGVPIVISTDTEETGAKPAPWRRGRGPTKRKSSASADVSTPEGSETDAKSKSRKQSPNWEIAEIIALIEEKMQDHHRKSEMTDNRDNIEKADMRWVWISDFVMKKTCSNEGASHYRDKDVCRDKWQGIYGDYKRIYDYLKGTGVNQVYEELSPDERAAVGLPRHYIPNV